MRTIDPDLLPSEVLLASSSLGHLISASRKARKMTQSQLCQAAGISRTTLLEIEHGSPRVQFAHWLSALHALQLLDNFVRTISADEMQRIAGAVRQPRSS
jgi:transcriptional regulator with XRE-family HTH domain